jgi:hypothetical protein
VPLRNQGIAAAANICCQRVSLLLQSTAEPRVAWLEEQLRALGMADGPAGTGLMMGSLCAGKFSLDGNW